MIDLVATLPKYHAHTDPVWDALPAKGRVVVRSKDRSCDAALVAGHQDLVRARRWGYTRIAYVEHGIGQSYGTGHPAYPGGRERDAVSLFLSPNDTAADYDRRAYPQTPVVVVGDPRLDTLPQRVPDGQITVAVSWHWSSARTTSPPELTSALAHYLPVLPDLGRAFHVIGHGHPQRRDLAELYAGLGWEFVPDFDEVCRRADVYVADNTSTLYEFASTGRPVAVLNAPWFRRDFWPGLRFWEAAHVGVNVNEPDELVPLVEGALADLFREEREDALSVAYGYRSGAGQRAADAITAWLSEEAVAA